jgi:hypothetical protein
MRLFKPVLEHVALVDNPASKYSFDLIKNEDGTTRFNWFIPFEKSDDTSGGIVGGLAWCHPLEKDAVGDWATRDDIREMMETHKAAGSRLNVQHKVDLTDDQAKVVETKIVENGAWYLKAEIYDEKIKEAVRTGTIRGWSIGGRCQHEKRSESDAVVDGLVEQHQQAEEREALTTYKAQFDSIAAELGIDPNDTGGFSDEDALQLYMIGKAKEVVAEEGLGDLEALVSILRVVKTAEEALFGKAEPQRESLEDLERAFEVQTQREIKNAHADLTRQVEAAMTAESAISAARDLLSSNPTDKDLLTVLSLIEIAQALLSTDGLDI